MWINYSYYPILPSSYSWLMGADNVNCKELDLMALDGNFPVVNDFLIALTFASLFGFLRIIIYNAILKVR